MRMTATRPIYTKATGALAIGEAFEVDDATGKQLERKGLAAIAEGEPAAAEELESDPPEPGAKMEPEPLNKQEPAPLNKGPGRPRKAKPEAGDAVPE